jgi:pimeloyl-ACP methyl ester carboxylesterase
MSPIFYKKQGNGPVIILLHGFPMNHEVWNEWALQLSSTFTVYTPDLPGFGQSTILPNGFSIAQVASRMLAWMDELHLDKVVVIGHSMGGYVALNMVEQRAASFQALVLFHSTATADSAEKKDSRTKVVRFIDDKGVSAFTSNFIAPLYADQSHQSIPFVREITMKSTASAVTGYTIAMRDREDTTQVLRDFKNPVLLIAGEKDPGIPVKTIRDQSRMGTHIQAVVLDDTGHMGMFERPEETLTVVKTFIFNISVR